MNKTEILDGFEDFWDRVLDAERDYLENQWQGPAHPSRVHDGWDEEFAASYYKIEPLLKPKRKKLFFQVPPGLRYQTTPIRVGTAHEAVLFFLNPAYMLYGEKDVLKAKEYIAMKTAAAAELQKIQDELLGKNSLSLPKDIKEKLKHAALHLILKDHHFPEYGEVNTTLLTEKQIAERMEVSQSTVHRLMAKLFKSNNPAKVYASIFARNQMKKGFRKKFDDNTIDIEGIDLDSNED